MANLPASIQIYLQKDGVHRGGIFAFLYFGMSACLHVCIFACLRFCMSAFLHFCMSAFPHFCIPTCLALLNRTCGEVYFNFPPFLAGKTHLLRPHFSSISSSCRALGITPAMIRHIKRISTEPSRFFVSSSLSLCPTASPALPPSWECLSEILRARIRSKDYPSPVYL